MHTTQPAPVGLSDIIPVPRFIRTHWEAQGLGTEQSFRWMLRYRHENGLIDSGAIIERKATPGSKRTVLFVVLPRFVDWFTNQTTKAAA